MPLPSKKKNKWKAVLILLLLALLCVGGAELLACRFADPLLYEQITQPVRSGWSYIWQNTCSAAHALEESLRPSETPKPSASPEALENQYAGAPAIWQELSASDPSLTKLEDRDGKKILTGGSIEIVYFNQGDDAWNSLPYGSDTIGKFGCGPTAMAMAVTSLTGLETDPAQMAVWAKGNNLWVKGSGSRLAIVEQAAAAYGLDAEPCRVFDPERLLQELSSGKIAVALMTKGHFTSGGHFILLRGTTLDGRILVADPASEDRSLTPWDPQLILDELSSSRSDGAPLWLLSISSNGD